MAFKNGGMALMIATIVGCHTAVCSAPRPLMTFLSPPAGNDFSVQQEVSLGREKIDLLRRDNPQAFVHNDEIALYIRSIVQSLQRHLPDDYPHLQVHIWLLRDSHENMGASAIAGGNIFIPLHTIVECSTIAVFATRLAHELGHVEMRHPTKWETQRKMLIDFIRNQDPNRPDSSAHGIRVDEAGWAVNTYLAIRNVEYEDEADLFAVRIAIRAGYDPHPWMSFLAEKFSYPERLTLLNEHRSGDDRARLMEAEFQRIEALRNHSFRSKFVSDRRFRHIQALAKELMDAT